MSPIGQEDCRGVHPDRQHGRTRGNRLDLIDISERDLHVIEIGTTVLVLLILLVRVSKSDHHAGAVVTIGISLATAQGVLSGAAELGLGISSQTIVS